jgi:hypothetical protein
MLVKGWILTSILAYSLISVAEYLSLAHHTTCISMAARYPCARNTRHLLEICLWISRVCALIILVPAFWTRSLAMEDLRKTGSFSDMDLETDENEHSIEMHLPYVRKMFEG